MPTPVDNALARITTAHGRTTSFNDTAVGGSRHASCGRTLSSWRSFTIYNHAAYGSRSTQGGGYVGFHSSPTFNIQHNNINVSIQVRMRGEIAKVRTAPGGYLYTLSSLGRPIVQFTGEAMWLLFDIKNCRNPDEALLTIYQLCYGALNQPLIQQLPDAINLDPHLDTTFNYVVGNPLQMRVDPTVVGTDATPATATPTARRRAAPPPPEYAGEGTTWKRPHGIKALKLEELRQDTGAVITYLTKNREVTVKRKLEEANRELQYAEEEYQRKLRELRSLEERRIESQAKIFGLARSVEMAGNAQLDEILVTQLKAVLENFYVAVWVDNKVIKALTQRIIMEQAGIMKADVGQFLVTIDDGRLDYRRQDGRVAIAPRIGSYAHAPHHNDTSICWGAYGTQINELMRTGDYAQALLMTYHHICSVTPTDAYIFLPKYCEQLDIKRKIDLAAGETDWPVEAPEKPLLCLAAPTPTRAVNNIEEGSLTPEQLNQLRTQTAELEMEIQRQGPDLDARPAIEVTNPARRGRRNVPTARTVAVIPEEFNGITVVEVTDIEDAPETLPVRRPQVNRVTPAEVADLRGRWRDVGTVDDFTAEPAHRAVEAPQHVVQQVRNEITEGRPLTAEERRTLGITAREMTEANPEAELQEPGEHF